MCAEAISLLTVIRRRALGAALAILLMLSLGGCAAGNEPPAETPAPTRPADGSGVWTGYFDAGDELLRSLGVDLSGTLSAPLLGTLRLEIDGEGRCVLTGDYRACEATLRAALTAFLRDLEEDEAGSLLSPLALADALGGDPEALAAAVCDELLPPAFTLRGRLNGDKSAIFWDGGDASPLTREAGGLRLYVPGIGETALSPQE